MVEETKTTDQPEVKPTATEVLKKRVNLITQGKYVEVKFPFTALTNITKALYPGTVTLLCGSPGSCKSLFLLQCLNHWHTEGEPTCILAIEGDMEHHMMRVLAQRVEEKGLTELDWIESHGEEVESILESNIDFTDEFAQTIHLPDKKNFSLDTTVNWVKQMSEEGKRVIAIDPVTKIPNGSAQGWQAEADFINHMEEIATEYGNSIILVTHPKNNVSKNPTMEALAGSAAYSRFTHCIIWLEAHDTITNNIGTPTGTSSMEHNRTMHCLKARNGDGQGLQDAFMFTPKGLKMSECGPVVKKG